MISIMIMIENVITPSPEQWEAIIRGMRNPMNSWDKSDSACFSYVDKTTTVDIARGDYPKYTKPRMFLGDNDLDLMTRLRSAGTDHRKFMRMITVYVDITAPLYWYKEFDTYKVGTVANSCSTMHKIAAKEFTVDDFSHEHLDGVSRDMFIQNDHDQPYFFCSFEDMLYIQVEALNRARNLYLKTKDKKYWWQMIQLLPSSYNQRRTVMLNYEVLTNMYHARKNHKLDEWVEFCGWIKTLPYSELITTDNGRKGDKS